MSAFWGNPALCSAVGAPVCRLVMLERQRCDCRLTFDFFFSPRGHGRNTEPQQWLTLSAWKEVGRLGGVGRGAGGVYLSHGNWFAGVEVGSFEKNLIQSDSLPFICLEGCREKVEKDGGREWRSAAAEAFSYKGWRKWVSVWRLNLMPAWNEGYFSFCILPNSVYSLSLGIPVWCLMHLFAFMADGGWVRLQYDGAGTPPWNNFSISD